MTTFFHLVIQLISEACELQLISNLGKFYKINRIPQCCFS